jgi:hypothetical protein
VGHFLRVCAYLGKGSSKTTKNKSQNVRVKNFLQKIDEMSHVTLSSFPPVYRVFLVFFGEGGSKTPQEFFNKNVMSIF